MLAIGAELCSVAQEGSGPPAILTQPQSQSVASGGSVTFSVEAEGAAPLRYQWRLNGTPVPNAINPTLTISNARLFNGGAYTAVVSNALGSATSAVAFLTVDPDLVFRIITLETNGAVSVDHNNLTGDDRGGIAVSANNVFYTGDGVSASGFNPVTVRFPLDGLTGGTSVGRGYDALTANLRTETVYSLGNGANLIQNANGLNFTTVNSLIEINGQTGQLTGERINLSSAISINANGNVGIFAGYDRVVIYNGSRVYSIALPSGTVTDLGAMASFSHAFSENWAFWGIAEYTGSSMHLVYVQNSQNIVRTRVPDRQTTALLALTNVPAFGDMASIGFSLSRSRWFFHHESDSIFRVFGEVIGSAKASYTTEAGYPALAVEPADLVSYPSSNVIFTATAVGAEPLRYQWHFNGEPLVGETSPSLSLTNLGTDAAGLYRLDVSNPVGLVSSRGARLTIYSVPQIVSHPQNRGVLPGTNVGFSVLANAAPPVSYQWRRDGTALPGAIGSTLFLPNVQASNAGLYSVVVSNRFGIATSLNAELFVFVPMDDGGVFRVTGLSSNGANTVEVYETLNLNFGYGPLTVSSNSVFHSTFNQTARNSADNLSGGALIARFYAALVSNLRTETVYAAGTATAPFNNYSGGNFTTLWEIDGSSGALGNNRITLSSAITLPSFASGTVAFFAGYDRVVVLIGNARAYSIALPSGAVTDLGPMASLQHGFSLSGAYWGIAEQFGGTTYLLYCQNNRNIVRARVPDGVTSIVATFPDLNSYFSSVSASVRRGRWYFSYQFGNSTFGFFNSGLGYANATFEINSGSKADHFEWGPISEVQVLNTPFPVTLTAKNTTNSTVTNFQGAVTLSGVNVTGSTPVAITPTAVSNFVNGVWTGQLAVLASSTGMVLRARDINGDVGVSGTFSVSPSNDLVLRIRDSPDPVVVGGAVTYTLSVTNTGPTAATGVLLTNQLPTNAVLVSFNSSHGTCTLDGSVLLCDLGTVNVGVSPTVTVILGATNETTLTYRASLVRGEADAALYNNSVTEVTEVRLPVLLIGDGSVVEANSGTNDLVFTIGLFPATTNTVSINFLTVAGSATPVGANADFLGTNGTLVFAPGSTNQTLNVRVRGDTLYEGNENFFISLNSPSNATLGRSVALGIIVNDDSPPFVSIGDVSVTEGNTALTNAVFQVRLSTNSGVAISVPYYTSDGSAVVGEDYTNASGIVVFPANTPNLVRNITVPVRGDTNIEPNEFFYVQIYSVTNALLGTDVGVGTIVNDDGGGVLHHFGWEPVPSPQPGNTPFPVTIHAQDVFDRTITSFSGTVQIAAGATGSEVEGTILGDADFTNSFNGNFTLGYSFTPKGDLIVTHFRHYTGTRISLWTEDGLLLASRQVQSSPGAWVETALNSTVALKADATYVLCYYTGGETQPYYYRDNPETDFADVTLVDGRFASGDLFPGSSAGLTGWAVDIRYLVSEAPVPVSITPIGSASFVNGIWSGALTVQTNTTNIILTARDNAQRSGTSSRFSTVPGTNSDLQVSLVASTNVVSVGSNVTCTIIAYNRGTLAAINVIITNVLPPGFRFISAGSSQGAVTNVGGVSVAQLGGLSQNAQATVSILARAETIGWHTNRASVGDTRPDPVLINNVATLPMLVFRDTDNDGMWDDWEQRYLLGVDDPGDAVLDSDGDGHTNLDEFMAGTDPSDANSALRILNIETTANGTRLIFQGVRGKTYRLESKAEANGTWALVLSFRIGTSLRVSEVIELIDPAPPLAETRMYRIQALLP
jgi:uncharacterized repeat protein (TIGR01451 family)